MKKKTLVLGASDKTDRYSNRAVKQLIIHGHPVIALGSKESFIDNTPIQKNKVLVDNIDTVTLYLNPARQKEYYDYILSLKPKRIIFNPGTENEAFEKLAQTNNIQTIEACTLVMLSTGQY